MLNEDKMNVKPEKNELCYTISG